MKLFLLVIGFVFVQGCITTDSLYRSDLSPDEITTWEYGIDRDKGRLAAELKDLRGPVLSRRGGQLHVWEARKGENVSYFIGTMHHGVSWSA